MTMIRSVAIALAVATVWGYFADLSTGQIGWFIGRLAFCTTVAVAGYYLFARHLTSGSTVTAGKVG